MKPTVLGNIFDSFRAVRQPVREYSDEHRESETPIARGESRVIEGMQLVRFEGDSTPRVLDVELAQRAGLAKPRAVRQLIASHRDELENFGTFSMRPYQGRIDKGGAVGGTETREVNAYWLNEAQAYHLVALMRTPKAAELRVLMTKVFMAWAHGELQGTVSDLATRIAKLETAHRDVTTIVRREVQPLRTMVENHAAMSESMQRVIKLQHDAWMAYDEMKTGHRKMRRRHHRECEYTPEQIATPSNETAFKHAVEVFAIDCAKEIAAQPSFKAVVHAGDPTDLAWCALNSWCRSLIKGACKRLAHLDVSLKSLTASETQALMDCLVPELKNDVVRMCSARGRIPDSYFYRPAAFHPIPDLHA